MKNEEVIEMFNVPTPLELDDYFDQEYLDLLKESGYTIFADDEIDGNILEYCDAYYNGKSVFCKVVFSTNIIYGDRLDSFVKYTQLILTSVSSTDKNNIQVVFSAFKSDIQC